MTPAGFAKRKEDRILALVVVLLILVGTIECWTGAFALDDAPLLYKTGEAS